MEHNKLYVYLRSAKCFRGREAGELGGCYVLSLLEINNLARKTIEKQKIRVNDLKIRKLERTYQPVER